MINFFTIQQPFAAGNSVREIFLRQLVLYRVFFLYPALFKWFQPASDKTGGFPRFYRYISTN